MGWRGHPTQSKWKLLLCEVSIHVGLLFGRPHIYFRAKNGHLYVATVFLAYQMALCIFCTLGSIYHGLKIFEEKNFPCTGYKQDFFLIIILQTVKTTIYIVLGIINNLAGITIIIYIVLGIENNPEIILSISIEGYL